MKKVIVILIVVNLLGLSGALSLLYLAETYPFHPAETLYPVQEAAEQARLQLASGRGGKAEYALGLAERRLADLAFASNPQQINAASLAFDAALVEVVERVEAAPEGARDEYFNQLDRLLVQAEIVANAFSHYPQDEALHALQEKIRKAIQASNRDEVRLALSVRASNVPVPFWGEMKTHGDFALEGMHGEVDCMQCHVGGEYAGTDMSCSRCHQAPTDMRHLAELYGVAMIGDGKLATSDLYPEHYPGECSDCHNTYNWTPDQFTHEGVLECASCHQDDLPLKTADASLPEGMVANLTPVDDFHYPGDCIDCHTDVEDWSVTEFDHGQVGECLSCHWVEEPSGHWDQTCWMCHTDYQSWQQVSYEHSTDETCSTCHQPDKPDGHFPGQCSRCHITDTWETAVFDHSYAGSCESCHAKPMGHYSGDCGSCHDDVSWNFKHNDKDCQSCHTNPGQHLDQQCSACHLTNTWFVSSADHAAQASCDSCHTSVTPAGHYVGACNDCHLVDDWHNTEIDHSILATDCLACHAAESGHFPGLCSTCHDTSGWAISNFDHTVATGYACLDCHDQPAGHYTNTTCQNCHDTENWGQVTFDHSGLTDCVVCHGIDDHYHTGCSSCHNTDDWSQATFDHTGYTDCISCHTQEEHYTTNCEACHKTSTWEPIFDHSDGADCQSCHLTPDGHWPGDCGDCHTVVDWTDYTFNHDGYTNCKACHSQDRPPDHPRGQCDRCHTTDTWTPPPTVILAAGVLTPTATTAVTATVTVEPTQMLTTTVGAAAQATPTLQPTEIFLETRRGLIPLPVVPNGVLPPRPEPGLPGEQPVATVQPNPKTMPTAPPVEEQPAPQITPTPLHPFRRALPPVGPVGNAGLPPDKTQPLPARAPVPDVQPMALPPGAPEPMDKPEEEKDLDRPRNRAADAAEEDGSEGTQPP